MASMPGLGRSPVGAVKAGADVQISGYDGGTGAAGEQSINHCVIQWKLVWLRRINI